MNYLFLFSIAIFGNAKQDNRVKHVLILNFRSQDIDFFQHLEMHMRSELPSLVGRDHLSFRSYYQPVRSVTDGDLCELYNSLDISKKKAIAEDLDRTPNEVSGRVAIVVCHCGYSRSIVHTSQSYIFHDRFLRSLKTFAPDTPFERWQYFNLHVQCYVYIYSTVLRVHIHALC